MLDELKCRLGFHKPIQEHATYKHKYRTTNKGRSRKRYYTVRELVTFTYCERCGKQLGMKGKRIYR